MRRREVLALLGGAAAWSLDARSQNALPVMGWLASGVQLSSPAIAFREGLKEIGYIDGQNVRLEIRPAEGHYDRLPSLAAELVRRQVAVLVATGGVQAALAAKTATQAIPIVFANGSDPVKFGLVASLNRPGSNITGVSFFTADLEAKRFGLLHELVPTAGTLAFLVNPTNPNAETQIKDMQDAAAALGLQIQVLRASSERELETAFELLGQGRVAALQVGSDPFFFVSRQNLVALAARHAVPAIYEWREFVQEGGLASYGTSLADAYRQAGRYAGRVLKGTRPADLPVVQPTKFELVINLQTAKALGLTVPPSLLAHADEVIE
jgi:putative ABC transport system substrate-binding protein